MSSPSVESLKDALAPRSEPDQKALSLPPKETVQVSLSVNLPLTKHAGRSLSEVFGFTSEKGVSSLSSGVIEKLNSLLKEYWGKGWAVTPGDLMVEVLSRKDFLTPQELAYVVFCGIKFLS